MDRGSQAFTESQRDAFRVKGRAPKVPVVGSGSASLAAYVLHVQRTAGNRAATRFVLEMAARSASKPEARAGGAPPGPAGGSLGVAGTVQRKVVWTGLEATHHPFKPAEDRSEGRTTLGYTPPKVNGVRADTQQAAKEALRGPGLMKVNGAWHVQPFDNRVGFEQDLMSDGPYEHRTTRKGAFLATEGHPDLGEWYDESPAGPATVRVVGQGGDHAKLKQQVKAHEDRHGADHQKVVQQILEPWDKSVSAIKPIEGSLTP